MGRRAIALVAVEAVFRVLLMQALAPPIPRDLGKNGGRRDGLHQGVALDDGLGLHIQHGQLVAIHQNQYRLQSQAQHRAAHGQQRGLQDVHAIDLFDRGLGNAAAQRLGTDLVIECLAARSRELLGIVQTLDGMEIVKNDSGGHHGAGQRAAARFVHARNQPRRMPGQARLFRRQWGQ